MSQIIMQYICSCSISLILCLQGFHLRTCLCYLSFIILCLQGFHLRVNSLIFVSSFFFFFFFIQHKKWSHDSGMTIFHTVNIWYTSHNMYLVYQSLHICSGTHIFSRSHIYKPSTVNYNKRAITSSICLRL